MANRSNPYRRIRGHHTQAEMAARVDVTRGRWAQLEGGQFRPSVVILDRVLDVFGDDLERIGWDARRLIRHAARRYTRG